MGDCKWCGAIINHFGKFCNYMCETEYKEGEADFWYDLQKADEAAYELNRVNEETSHD